MTDKAGRRNVPRQMGNLVDKRNLTRRVYTPLHQYRTNDCVHGYEVFTSLTTPFWAISRRAESTDEQCDFRDSGTDILLMRWIRSLKKAIDATGHDTPVGQLPETSPAAACWCGQSRHCRQAAWCCCRAAPC